MNRETKRAMARQQRTADPARLQQMRKQQVTRQRDARTGTAAPGKRKSRMQGVSSFGGEVVSELKKVNWPDRRTVMGYTVVVLVSVTVITTIIFGLDTLFGKAALWIFTR